MEMEIKPMDADMTLEMCLVSKCYLHTDPDQGGVAGLHQLSVRGHGVTFYSQSPKNIFIHAFPVLKKFGLCHLNWKAYFFLNVSRCDLSSSSAR